MSKPVRLDEEAQNELDAAVQRYDHQTGRTEIGTELLDAVAQALLRLAERPASHALANGVRSELGVRRRLLRRFPFAIVFVELEDEIRVLAIAHSKRRPG